MDNVLGLALQKLESCRLAESLHIESEVNQSGCFSWLFAVLLQDPT